VTPHAGPSAERWSEFTLVQQIIMIANDLNRASKWMDPEDRDLRRSAYARALALTDLTAAGNHRLSLRRELLRWRDLLAQLYLEQDPSPERNAELLKVLLRFTFETSRQIRHTPGLA
jgi:hypothetical protein